MYDCHRGNWYVDSFWHQADRRECGAVTVDGTLSQRVAVCGSGVSLHCGWRKGNLLNIITVMMMNNCVYTCMTLGAGNSHWIWKQTDGDK